MGKIDDFLHYVYATSIAKAIQETYYHYLNTSDYQPITVTTESVAKSEAVKFVNAWYKKTDYIPLQIEPQETEKLLKGVFLQYANLDEQPEEYLNSDSKDTNIITKIDILAEKGKWYDVRMYHGLPSKGKLLEFNSKSDTLKKELLKHKQTLDNLL